MSAEEFWKDDPQLFVSYRTSFVNKKKRELEELDYKCWRQGLYNYDGNGKLLYSFKQFISNILSIFTNQPKDTTEIETYPIKPYGELQKDKIEEKNKKEKERNTNYQEYQNSLIYYGTLKKQYLDKLKKKGE